LRLEGLQTLGGLLSLRLVRFLDLSEALRGLDVLLGAGLPLTGLGLPVRLLCRCRRRLRLGGVPLPGGRGVRRLLCRCRRGLRCRCAHQLFLPCGIATSPVRAQWKVLVHPPCGGRSETGLTPVLVQVVTMRLDPRPNAGLVLLKLPGRRRVTTSSPPPQRTRALRRPV